MKNQIQAPQTKLQVTIQLKKALYIFLFFFLSVKTISAQEIITFRNGSIVEAKIIEITPEVIKYKNFDNLNGPIRVIAKNDVAIIKYRNGEEEVYTTNLISNANEAPNTQLGKADSTLFVPETIAKFGGPRFGLTYITAGTLASRLTNAGKNPFITQFGWQFEKRMFNVDKGPTGIIELITLVGGMEQGLFLPSASLLIGLRSGGKKSVEFAIGPNVSVAGLGMVFAVGANFKSGKVNFPINLAYVPSVSKKEYDRVKGENVTVGTGHRITLTIGFNMRKK
jgi:hypothetical protein